MPLVDQIAIDGGTKTVSSGIDVYDYGETFALFNKPKRYCAYVESPVDNNYYAESANDYPSFKPNDPLL